jgi:hypothetical protein
VGHALHHIRPHLSAPPLGEPLRHGLGGVEPATQSPSPMQGHRHQHAPRRRSSPPLGHPLAQGASRPRESPVLDAVHHLVRAFPQPKPKPQHLDTRSFSSQNARRAARSHRGPRPTARGTNPRHLVGHQRLPTPPTPSKSPSPIHTANMSLPPTCLRTDFAGVGPPLTGEASCSLGV